MKKSISIFIPAYNAEKTLFDVIRRIPKRLWSDIKTIYVINDGSNDNTQEIINSITTQYTQCVSIRQYKNLGYGKTVKNGLIHCKQDGCNFAVCLHADGQYSPEIIPEAVHMMIKNNIDILQGSRIAAGAALKGGMPLYKYAAGRILSFLESIVLKLNLSDYHSGFLVYSRYALNTLQFNKLSNSFDFDIEILASAQYAGCTIGEIPIPTRYADEVSYLNPIGYGCRVLFMLCKALTGRYETIYKKERL